MGVKERKEKAAKAPNKKEREIFRRKCFEIDPMMFGEIARATGQTLKEVYELAKLYTRGTPMTGSSPLIHYLEDWVDRVVDITVEEERETIALNCFATGKMKT